MRAALLIAAAIYIGAILIILGVLAHIASTWVRARRLRTDALAARRPTLPHQSRRGRIPVKAIGDRDV